MKRTHGIFKKGLTGKIYEFLSPTEKYEAKLIYI